MLFAIVKLHAVVSSLVDTDIVLMVIWLLLHVCGKNDNDLFLRYLPADLTEFVQQRLFGSDLSPPLTRSGIHSASRTEVSFNRHVPFL